MHNSVIGLAKTFAPSFKKRPEKLSKPAALDTLVFFKTVKIVFSETVARLKIALNNAFVMLKDSIESKFIWAFRKLFEKVSSKVRIIIFESA